MGHRPEADQITERTCQSKRLHAADDAKAGHQCSNGDQRDGPTANQRSDRPDDRQGGHEEWQDARDGRSGRPGKTKVDRQP